MALLAAHLMRGIMDVNSSKLIEQATPEELAACIQLLALSIVQHRAQSGFVSLQSTAQALLPLIENPSSDSQSASELAKQIGEIADEGLERVRVLAEEAKSTQSHSNDNARDDQPSEDAAGSDQRLEKRQQLRISVTAPVKIVWPGKTDPESAKLENISWGGAALRVEQIHLDAGDTLNILLPSTKGGSITIEAKVLRTWELHDAAGFGLATRFSSLSTADEAELENVLELLAQSSDSDGQRNHARLTQRLDLQFDDLDELQATLDDISEGGLGITVPEPLQIGQSLQAVISAMDGDTSLKLRARVVRQEPIDLGRVEFYQVGLKLEHPTPELAERTKELLRQMATNKKG